MKKILIFFVAIFATCLFAQAQVLLSESFDTGVLPAGWTTVDADGDGYNWDPTYAMGDLTPHSGASMIISQSYIGGIGALTPDNWLISPQINIPSASSLTFWAWGQDSHYSYEHFGVYVSTTGTNTSDFTQLFQATTTSAQTQYTVDLSAYAGQSIHIAFRHYNVTDMLILNLDDVVVFTHPTVPTIVTSSTSLTYAATTIDSVSASQSVNVTTYLLTNNVTATTASPFEISTDNINFGSTAVLDTAGGVFYVRYEPTVSGTNNGAVTLSSPGATDVTVSLTGTGVDCSEPVSTFPYFEDFESGVPPMCWTNGGTEGAWIPALSSAYEGTMASVTYNSFLIQEERLITQPFDFSACENTILMDFTFITSSTVLSWNNGLDSVFSVTLIASTDGGQTWESAPLWSAQDELPFELWAEVDATVDISRFAGEENVKFAFRYYRQIIGAQFLLDDVTVYVYNDPIIIPEVENLSFRAETNQNEDRTINVRSYNLANPVAVTTSAPFSVSADGTNFGTTASLETGNATLYVRYTGVTGEQTGTLTLSSAGAQDVVVNLSAKGYDCDAVEFPIVENFNANEFPIMCWTMIYGNNNPSINPMSLMMANVEGTDFIFAFSSMNVTSDYTQYLITPRINFDGEMALTFRLTTLNSVNGASAETFMIGTSSTTNDVDAFTWSEEFICNTPGFSDFYREIPAGTKYVAIKYTSENSYYLFVDDIELRASTAIEEIAEDMINVYPNPTRDLVNVNAPVQINNVELFNAMGQRLSTYAVEGVSAQINVSELANGIYFLKVNTVNGVITKKINVVK